MDVTLKSRQDNSSYTLVNVKSDEEASGFSSGNITNNILVKDVEIVLSNINSIKVFDINKGNLNFENSFLNLEQDEFTSGDSNIYLFKLSGSTTLDLVSSRINVKSNYNNVYSIFSDSASVNVLNSFMENNESLSEQEIHR